MPRKSDLELITQKPRTAIYELLEGFEAVWEVELTLSEADAVLAAFAHAVRRKERTERPREVQ